MAKSSANRQIRHKSVPINPNRITRGDVIIYPNQQTKHTHYRIPRDANLEQAIEQVRRYKPNAYAFQVLIHKGYGKKGSIVTQPFDPDDPELGTEMVGIALGKCHVPKSQQPKEPTKATGRGLIAEVRPWEKPTDWRIDIVAIE